MLRQSVATVGDGNIAGNNLNNVGNIQNIFTGPQRDNALAMLELKVAFDALLNSGARYPAPKCHIDTRKAAQAVVTDWICGRGEWAEKGIMWISGAPGVGKSAIVQTVCEELDTDDGSETWFTRFVFARDRKVGGHYFFGRGQGDREKVSFLPATIAFQLSRSSTSCHDVIANTLNTKLGILSETFPSQFRQLLTATAKKRWSFQSSITVVIDALDECDDLNDQVELLKLILEAITTTKMRFLIASRPEHQIHTFFQREDVSQHTYHVRLDEETFNTSRDIEVFLRAEFARIRREKPHLCLPLPTGEDWPGNVIVIRIRDDSDSQFIFPTLAIGFIDTPSYTPDQQLQILLAAPPPRAFSKLDALYERILSRCPPDLQEGSDELVAYQKLVLDILAVVVALSEPIHATTIAGVLKTNVDVVQNIVLGLMRSLFKVDTSKPNSLITLCHKSLRDYLLDIERSHKFFIPSSDADGLFISILSRSPPSDRWYSRDELKEVLGLVANLSGGLTVSRIASVLDIDPRLVQSVVSGPARALFHEDTNSNIHLSTSSLKNFLHDVGRSRDFFVQAEVPDAIFTRILSLPPPSDPLHSYCQDDLLDVLTAVMICDGPTTESEIEASLLGVDVNIVRRVVLGPARALFHTSNGKIQYSTSSFRPFLRDITRSGEFHIRGIYKADAIFIRILSRQPPSDPSRSYSREVLMGVLSMVMERGNRVKVPEIASFLDVAPSIVEGVVFGPAKALFKLNRVQSVDFSMYLFKDFLLDANRAGEFLIPREKPLDTLFIQILSRQPPSDPSRSYSREVLMGVLSMVMERGNRVKVPEIASFLDVAPSLVEGVVFGPAKGLFDLDSVQDVDFSIPSFKSFLLDANRAGDYFIPSDKPLDTLFIQILSRQPPSDPSRSYSREVLMGVLSMVVERGNWVKVPEIASFLDVAPSIVEGVVFGPAKALFKLNRVQSVDFSMYLFKDFLLDANRAGEFLIPREKPLDTLFIQILSRQPPSDPSRSYSREVLMGVLSMVVERGNWLKVPEIASFLDVAPSIVEGVIFGPAKGLFELDSVQNVNLSRYSFKSFLLDANRAGEFFVSQDRIDTHFTKILSRQPPSDPSQSYSREVLMGVLRVLVVWPRRLSVAQIASTLDADPAAVEGVVFGPAKALFKLDRVQDVDFSLSSFKDFLLDANRAGEYFIPSDTPLDTLFTQILSRQPPSDPSQSYSREVLMGVLRVLVVWPRRLSVAQIASTLDADPAAVEGVVFGPAKALFKLDRVQDVDFSLSSFKDFLLDANRAGEYFIPSDTPLDTLFTQILSRQPPSGPSLSYSREVLMGVLRVLVVWPRRLSVAHIASILDVDPAVVKAIVFGTSLFHIYTRGDILLIPEVAKFLQDADRAGEYYIPPKDLYPNYNSMYAKIRKICWGF